MSELLESDEYRLKQELLSRQIEQDGRVHLFFEVDPDVPRDDIESFVESLQESGVNGTIYDEGSMECKDPEEIRDFIEEVAPKVGLTVCDSSSSSTRTGEN